MKRFILLIIVLLVSIIGYAQYGYASLGESIWQQQNLVLHEESNQVKQNTDTVDSKYQNKPWCSDTQFYTNYTVTSVIPYSAVINGLAKGCVVYTPNGAVSSSGYFIKNGLEVAGMLKQPKGYTIHKLVPIKNSSTLIAYEVIGARATKLRFIYNAYSNLRIKTGIVSGPIEYTITKTPSAYIKNERGEDLTIITSTLRFSHNSEWAVADSLNSGSVRIHIPSGTVTSFGYDFSYTPWGGSNTEYGISDDGLYIAGASHVHNFFYIYDLRYCNSSNTKYPYNNTCFKRDIKKIVQTYKPSFSGGAHRFEYVGNALRFVGLYDVISNTSKTIAEYVIAPTEADAMQAVGVLDYLALGDSFASGEGVYAYKLNTDSSTNKCHVSLQSYPYILGEIYNYTNRYETVACSGAKIKDIVLTNLFEYNDSDPQSKNKTNDSDNNEIYSNYLPGYRAQLKFVERTKPSIITMSMGGNNIGFSDIIKKCVVFEETCYDTYEERVGVVSSINAIYPELVSMYTKLKESRDDVRIYIVGYPKFAVSNGNCANNVKLNTKEIDFGNAVVDYLNTVIEYATLEAGVAYVDVSESFAGYKLCETNSDSVAMNGLTIGNDSPFDGYGPLGKEAYHPNKLGHILFAKTIKEKTSDFTKQMPLPAPQNIHSIPESSIALLRDVPKTDVVRQQYRYDESISFEQAYLNQDLHITVSGDSHAFNPNSVYSASIHSNPVLLSDTIISDENGNINATVTIPTTIPVGYHTLHIQGKNILGQPVDVARIIYVVASASDYNGNGIPNNQEVCAGIVAPSSKDVDTDGIDDACDGFIDIPPSADKTIVQSESRPPRWLLALEEKLSSQLQYENVNTEDSVNQSQSSITNNQQPQSLPVSNTKQQKDGAITDVAGVSSAVEEITHPKRSYTSLWVQGGLPFLFVVTTATIVYFYKRRGV